MCGKNIDGGSSRGWWCLLVLFALVMLSPPLRGDVLQNDPPQNTRPQSQNTSESMDNLLNVWESLKRELTESGEAWNELSKQLEEAQRYNEELKSSLTQWIALWQTSRDSLKAEREAAMSLLSDMSDQIDAEHRLVVIWRGITIGVTVAGVIGWVLWAVK